MAEGTIDQRIDSTATPQRRGIAAMAADVGAAATRVKGCGAVLGIEYGGESNRQRRSVRSRTAAATTVAAVAGQRQCQVHIVRSGNIRECRSVGRITMAAHTAAKNWYRPGQQLQMALGAGRGGTAAGKSGAMADGTGTQLVGSNIVCRPWFRVRAVCMAGQTVQGGRRTAYAAYSSAQGSAVTRLAGGGILQIGRAMAGYPAGRMLACGVDGHRTVVRLAAPPAEECCNQYQMQFAQSMPHAFTPICDSCGTVRYCPGRDNDNSLLDQVSLRCGAWS